MEALATIRPELLTLSDRQFEVLVPYFAVIAGLLFAIVLAVSRLFSPKWIVFILSLLTAGAGIYYSFGLIDNDPVAIFNSMMVSDSYSNFFNVVFLGSALLTCLISFRYLDDEKIQYPEYYLLVLLSTVGMMLMTSALDLIVLFIALELMSLSVYTLVGFRRADRKSNEAAVKYFVLGGAASAVLLYGAALLYGATGSTNIQDILAHVNHEEGATFLYVLGAWFVIAGFLFKVASVPFHMWMPDVYEGAPAPITGFMTTGLKAASFAAFVRVLISLGYGQGLEEVIQGQLHNIIWICAVCTMVIGNTIALTQTNLKRMLAYSSIAHTGYIMIGILAAATSSQGYAPVVMYLVIYAIMNIGAFAILTTLAGPGDEGLNLHDLSGLAGRHPWLSLCMAIFLLSMAGIPPTAGFVAKYLMFYSAIQAQEVLLVVIGVLTSAVSVYYYLRVLVYMYMRDPVGSEAVRRVPIWSVTALAAMALLTLQLGVVPSELLELARKAVTSL